MLKLDNYSTSTFDNFKCGEIFCVSPSVFDLSCLLCPRKFGKDLEKFICHIQVQHLPLAEETITLKSLQQRTNRKSKSVKKLQDTLTIKEEEPEEDDPINFICKNPIPDLTEAVFENHEEKHDDEDDKCLIELINESTTTNSKQTNEDVEEKHNAEQIFIDEVPRKKPLTRNAKKRRDDSTSPLKAVQLEESERIEEDKKELKITLKIKKTKTEIKDAEPIVAVEAVNLTNDDDGEDEDKDWSDQLDNKDTESSSSDSEEGLPFPCLECKRSYRTKDGLKNHNYRVHNPNKPPPKRSRKHKPKHKCDVCNELFRSARDLGGHKWKHTGIVCDICGKTFTQTGNMIRHKIRHTGIKAHKCKDCSKDFFTAKELNSHMICHTGVMPLVCEICGRRCRDRGVLKAHMRRHTGERPAKCDVCGKSFFSFHDLNVHAVSHTSDRPFKCDICGSTFQRKKALRVHKLIHSKDRRHVCKICGKGFAQTGGLNSHMRSHDAAIERAIAESTSANIPSTNVGNQLLHAAVAMASTTSDIDVQILGEYVV